MVHAKGGGVQTVKQAKKLDKILKERERLEIGIAKEYFLEHSISVVKK